MQNVETSFLKNLKTNFTFQKMALTVSYLWILIHQGVALFEQTLVWLCWQKCITGYGFEVSKLHTRPSVVALSICGSKWSSWLLFLYHTCLLIAMILLNIMRMDQVSETVSKPIVRVALVMESFHSTRIVTKTMGILCILLTDGYVQTHMYEIYRAFLFHCLF